jgi:hypothetical protein
LSKIALVFALSQNTVFTVSFSIFQKRQNFVLALPTNCRSFKVNQLPYRFYTLLGAVFFIYPPRFYPKVSRPFSLPVFALCLSLFIAPRLRAIPANLSVRFMLLLKTKPGEKFIWRCV